MYSRGYVENADALFLSRSRRPRQCVYFVRVFRDGTGVQDLIWKFYECVERKGVHLEERILNPDQRELAYMTDVLGTSFEPTESFVNQALVKWMPRMTPKCREDFTAAMLNQFSLMRRENKPETAIRNVYTKMMCWLYYKFDRIIPYLGDDEPPRILYEGSHITGHELYFLNVLSSLGADIFLLEIEGDEAYLKLDPSSACSQVLNLGVRNFDKGFSIRELRKKKKEKPPVPNRPGPVIPPTPVKPSVASVPMPQPQHRSVEEILSSHFPKPTRTSCANAWMKEADIQAILEPAIGRGEDPKLFYHTYISYLGARDRLTYTNELFQLYQKLLNAKRQVLVIDGRIPTASTDEISRIRRRPYRTLEELIIDLAGNLPAAASQELQREQQAAYVEVVRKLAREEPNLNRLTGTVVKLLCLIQRYQAALFQGYKDTACPCFIRMGEELNAEEKLFVQYLARLPVDVLILSPDLNAPCGLSDEALLEIRGTESLSGIAFPKQESGVQMRTVASMAEQDLDTILYGQSGMYRHQQFGTAQAITLKTTYDELFILWNQELKYRPNFSTEGRTVNMPVLYAKVSGVEGGKIQPYWQKIKLMAESGDTILYRHLPMQPDLTGGSGQSLAVKYLKNGVIRRQELKADRKYPFGHLREELQNHILDKVQQMLDQRLIRGTFENGTEYTILGTVLDMSTDIQRKLQAFDFTRSNPKILCVHTSEGSPNLVDAILCTFYNLVGMDVVLFVPTGYQTIERFLQGNLPVEHQIGDYMYDQQMPDLSSIQAARERGSWLENLLRRR